MIFKRKPPAPHSAEGEHDFGNWVSVETPLTRVSDGSPCGSFIVQQRKCKTCDFTEFHKQRITI